MTASACIFCDIAAGQGPAHVVWADHEAVVFLDRNPIALGHLLVIPRRHFQTLWDMDETSFLRLMSLVRRLTAPLTEATGSDRAGMAVEGYGVPHAHIHLVPINGGGELDPCRQSPASDDDLAVTAASIRAIVLSYFVRDVG